LIALFFGLFQGVMPILGYFLGSLIADFIASIDHYIALILLAIIGAKMIYDGTKKKEEALKTLSLGNIIVQAIATSIDAFVVGVSFAAVGLSIPSALIASSWIAIITFILSFVGVFIGKKIGTIIGGKAEIIGGLILIGIGIKIFVQHMLTSG
jgi:putative Mn2+ efflux pump MntP